MLASLNVIARTAAGVALTLAAWNSAAAADAPKSVSAADYDSAERFLRGHMPRYVDNADIEHHWIGNEDKFWYLRVNAAGAHEFIVIDAATGRRSAAFDQTLIAGA